MSTDITTTTPELVGRHAMAWDYVIPGKMNATIKAWVVRAPMAHPAWHSYMIGVCHLRPMEGFAKPVLYDPRATHEIFVYALNPNQVMNVGEDLAYLSPANYAEQWTAESDEAAVKQAESVIREICDGKLSPDTDYQAAWLARFPFQNPGRARKMMDAEAEAVASGKLSGSDGQTRSRSVH